MKRRVSIRLRVQRTLCIAFLAVLGLIISCDLDRPTQPQPPPPPPVDNGYNFYVLLRSYSPSPYASRVYIFNTKQMTYVNSILYSDPYDYDDIEVSPDEKYLTLSTVSDPTGNITILDLATRQPILTYANTHGDIEFSPNGKYLVIQGNIPHWYLDASTLDTVAIDSGAGGGGAWDSTGNIFCSLRRRNDTCYIRRFDVSIQASLPEVAFIDTLFPADRVVRLQTTADPNKIFLYMFYGFNTSRVVSYTLSDSTIEFSRFIVSENTEFAVTPDWKTVLFSDPANMINSGSMNIYVADAHSDQLETIILVPVPQSNQFDSNAIFMNPNQIAVSPDGKYAMVGGLDAAWHGIISIEERKYVAFMKPSWLDGFPWRVASWSIP